MSYTKEDLAYIAGFFDGEGSLSLFKLKKGNDKMAYYPRFQLYNTDEKILIYIQKILGGTLTCRIRSTKYKPLYVLTITSMGNVIRVLELIKPYTKLKKGRVDAVLSFCYSRLENKRYNESEIANSELVYLLNKRGLSK